MESRDSCFIKTAVVFAVSTCLLIVMGLANTARADGGGDPGWVKETTDRGCFRLAGKIVSSLTLQGQSYVWTGPCTPGQPISGEGTFYGQYPDGTIIAFTGRIVDGFPDGPIRFAVHQMNGGRLGPMEGNERIVNYRMGCPEDLGSYCQPGSPSNLVIVPQVSPAHFPLQGAHIGGTEATATAGPEKIRITTGSLPDPRISAKQVQTSLPNGETLSGATNLDCVLFQPSTGANARSSLINQCGEEVRLNYCLVYKNGHDTCAPMRTGWEATLWPVRAGQPLTMPAADTLKLWSVFGCRAPLFPIYARFNGTMLTDGFCAEDGLAPPPAQAGQITRIVRSNDPSTWPPGGSNKKCIQLSPQLVRGVAYVKQNCESDLNAFLCFVPNGSRFSGMACVTNMALPYPVPWNYPRGDTIWINPPNTYAAWFLFACDAPLVPSDLFFDGTEMTATCKPRLGSESP